RGSPERLPAAHRLATGRKFFHVGLTPLPDALRDTQYIGEDRVAARVCNAFLFRDGPQAFGRVWLRYCLDREARIPLAVDVYRNEGDYRQNQPYRSWRV